jgi:hypothetical protein
MRKALTPVLCLIASTTLKGSRHAPEAEIQPETTFTATVSAIDARFLFPLEKQREWIWYQSTTPDNMKEYEWSVEVENGGTRYQFGFFLFKLPGSSPVRGDLGALIHAGQVSIASAVGPLTQTRMTVLPDRQIHIAYGQGVLVVSFTDLETLRMLFSERPPLVIFKVRVPGASEVSQSVEIAYY